MGNRVGLDQKIRPWAVDHLEEDEDRHPWVNHLVGKDRYIRDIRSAKGSPYPYKICILTCILGGKEEAPLTVSTTIAMPIA